MTPCYCSYLYYVFGVIISLNHRATASRAKERYASVPSSSTTNRFSPWTYRYDINTSLLTSACVVSMRFISPIVTHKISVLFLLCCTLLYLIMLRLIYKPAKCYWKRRSATSCRCPVFQLLLGASRSLGTPVATVVYFCRWWQMPSTDHTSRTTRLERKACIAFSVRSKSITH